MTHITDAIVEWLRANPAGLTVAEALDRFGSTPKAMQKRLLQMRRKGRIAGRRDPQGCSYWTVRYFAPEHDPGEAPAKPKALRVRRKSANRQVLVVAPKQAAAADSKAITIKRPAKGAALSGEVTYSPKFTGVQRAMLPAPQRAPAVFSSLALGNYLPSNTHMSRVYGNG